MFTAEDVDRYARITGDRNPLHFDEGSPRPRGSATAWSRAALPPASSTPWWPWSYPGRGAFFLHQEWDYTAPVYVGDTVTAEAEMLEARAGKPIIRLRYVARRQDGGGAPRRVPGVHDAPEQSF
jgi:acyl dehydratase